MSPYIDLFVAFPLCNKSWSIFLLFNKHNKKCNFDNHLVFLRKMWYKGNWIFLLNLKKQFFTLKNSYLAWLNLNANSRCLFVLEEVRWGGYHPKDAARFTSISIAHIEDIILPTHTNLVPPNMCQTLCAEKMKMHN